MNTQSGVEASSNNEIHRGQKKEDIKQHVSPTGFLPHLKDFSISSSKYKHYGHLMTSQQLSKIINSDSPQMADEKEPAPPKPIDSPSESNPVTSPLASPTELMAKALELPAQKLYSEAVVSQMLMLRIEQEKTKQAREKVELGRIVEQLMKDAEKHGFAGNLIRRIFLDDDHEEYKSHIEKMAADAASGIFPKPRLPSANRLMRTPSPNKPHVPPIITDASANQQQISHISNDGRLLPPLVVDKKDHHVRARSDGTMSSGSATDQPPPITESGDNTPSIAGTRTTPVAPAIPQPSYPLYYQQTAEQHQQLLGQARPTPHHPPTSLGEALELGLPQFSHNFCGPVYQSLHIDHQMQQQQQQQQQQQRSFGNLQPYFYVNSLPPGAPVAPLMMSSQYFVAPPGAVNTAPGMVPWNTPSVPQEKRKDHHDNLHTHKKPRGGSKNGISFMISTPKNPPARKYNKPSGTA